MRGSSMPDIGALNELVVLHAVRIAPEGRSQSDVVRRSGLSRQAVSLITRRLIERGLVETAGTRANGRGKPSTVLRAVPGALLAAGVHLDPAHISVVVVDLSARVLAERTLDAPSDDPQADVARIADALTAIQGDLRWGAWTSPAGADVTEALLGLGIAVPGGLDARRGVVLEPPWLPGWWNIPLVQMLQEATGLRAVLDKDTNAALTAENWGRAQAPEQTVLYIYVGAGVGSAVASDGLVRRGATTQAGEIGHLPTGLDGPRCECGRRACLGLYTDVATMLERARSEELLPAAPGARAIDDLAALAERAAAGEGRAIALFEQHGTALGEALRTLIGVHDPRHVIIGGPYWHALAEFSMPHVRERALRGVLQKDGVEITSSALGDDVGAIGAASLFLEHELSPMQR